MLFAEDNNVIPSDGSADEIGRSRMPMAVSLCILKTLSSKAQKIQSVIPHAYKRGAVRRVPALQRSCSWPPTLEYRVTGRTLMKRSMRTPIVGICDIRRNSSMQMAIGEDTHFKGMSRSQIKF
jgi:hypothetical protein